MIHLDIEPGDPLPTMAKAGALIAAGAAALWLVGTAEVILDDDEGAVTDDSAETIVWHLMRAHEHLLAASPPEPPDDGPDGGAMAA